MGAETLRALNEGVNQGELDKMGITEGVQGNATRSSFAFDHVTADFGPGASAAREELRAFVAEVRGVNDALFDVLVETEEHGWEEVVRDGESARGKGIESYDLGKKNVMSVRVEAQCKIAQHADTHRTKTGSIYPRCSVGGGAQ